MATYAALVSLMNIIDEIQHHPRPPISLDKQQVESLTKAVALFKGFLEKHRRIGGNNEEGDGLMTEIANAAYAIEDAIESHVVDQIHAGSTSRHGRNIDLKYGNMEVMALLLNVDYEMLTMSSMDMSFLLITISEAWRCVPPIYQQQLRSLDEKVTFVKEFLQRYRPYLCKNEEGNVLIRRISDVSSKIQHVLILDQYRAGSTSDGRGYYNSIEFHQGLQKVIQDMDLIKNETMEIKERMTPVQHQLNTTAVGFDDVLQEFLDKLTHHGRPDRQLIPIVGMGGIGKTTLARNIYENPLVKEYFYVHAWISISQEYNTRQILSEVICQVNPRRRGSSLMDEDKIGEELHKYLYGRRYLIMMDDMWSIEVWDKIRFFFPDCNNGSRIVVTTRLSNLARQLTDSYVHDMKFLNELASWDLFSKIVFPKQDCPPYLEKLGKKIVRRCRGLPLSIVVIGGLLAKSLYTRQYWKHIEKNLSSTVNSENEEQCLKVLLMSYNELPVHLKPCFLYMGVFKKDSAIRISKLVKLWTAEGFLKPISGQSLEEVAKQYLQDLVDRNLVLVQKEFIMSGAKCVDIHDLFRDFCLRQARQERFYSVVEQDVHSQRRLILSGSGLGASLSMPLARSLICNSGEALPSLDLRLLRIFEACTENLFFLQENALQLVNLRYISVPRVPLISQIASSWNLLWSLQTLIVYGGDECFAAPPEIWNVHKLRHVQVRSSLRLPNPPSEYEIVLENLQTLVKVKEFNCSEEVVKRIPNVKKLGVEYSEGVEEFDLDFDRLHNLNSFDCTCVNFSEPISATGFLERLTFPHSLTKLSFNFSSVVPWDGVLEKTGSLPLLEKLKLINGSFGTRTWETVEGQFPNLKVLKILFCEDLQKWTSESSHFPRLEHLHLSGLVGLSEIPSEFGEIATLRFLELNECSDSSVLSAKGIQDQQVELHGEEGALRVKVILSSNQGEELESFASPIFKVFR